MARKRVAGTATWQDYRAAILAGLDLAAECEALGVELTGRPGEDGWCPCRAVDREDLNPSAAVNLKTGHYRDLGGVGLSLSFFDLAAHVKRFASWKDARDYYAAKAGVASPANGPPRDPAEHLVFQPWSEPLVSLWCRHKPGVTPEAVQAAGGRLARYRDQYTVVALPVFGPGLTAADPIGWVLWNTTGRDLPVFSRGQHGAATEWRKMKTTGGSESGLIGRHALDRLASPVVDPTRQLVWKVEGPADAMALWSIIPPEKRDRHFVVTQSGGASQTPAGWMVNLFAGRLVAVVGDADKAGQAGARKWAAWAAAVASEVRMVSPGQLGFEVQPDHGQDLRDWIAAGGTYAGLLELLDTAEVVQPPGTGQPAGESAEHVENGQQTVAEVRVPAAPADTGEAPDDPHRLARLNLERYASRHGGRTLRYWRDEWYVWKRNRYQKISKEEFRAKVTRAVKEEFDCLYRADLAAHVAEARDGQEPPVCRKVTMPIVSGTIQATASMVCLSGDIEPNTWLPTRERRHYVSFTNGILDLDGLLAGADESACFHPNSSDWFSMVSLPYAFDPAAKCPLWDEFLEFNLEMDPERIKVVQEWAGYLLTDDISEQKFMVLEGEGANGKSVYTAVLTAMLGQENVSTVPLEKFGDRFSLTTTLGKLLNACGDCGDLDKAAEGDLKTFTGGDRMFFDRKGIAGIHCRPTARLMLACNNRPRFTDRSEGVWRRMLIIPWRVQIGSKKRVRGMDEVKWWADRGQLPGILNWAIVGLARLRAQNGFSYCRLMEEALADYREEMNPARTFLLNHLESCPDGRIRSSALYSHYARWAKNNGYHPLGEKSFGREVRRVFRGVEKNRGGTRGERYWYYQGVAFTQDEIEGESTHDALLF